MSASMPLRSSSRGASLPEHRGPARLPECGRHGSMIDEIIDALVVLARPDGRPTRHWSPRWETSCRFAGPLPQSPCVEQAPLHRNRPSARPSRMPTCPFGSGPGLALTTAGEKDAMKVLIDLLTKSPMEGGWEVEDCLLRLAAGTGPGCP